MVVLCHEDPDYQAKDIVMVLRDVFSLLQFHESRIKQFLSYRMDPPESATRVRSMAQTEQRIRMKIGFVELSERGMKSNTSARLATRPKTSQGFRVRSMKTTP